ncbi:molybdopterin molybdotransferase MoeA [Alkalibacter mobilis]|uniref:molybdopterin molybdotransferase MoeA n=1 Tax=Alkalibacter mobilis TaxID=2787712 RepID=UPI00189F97FC|nr:gephyrin-like molybdotransferase Glp [Alkalibacter mobilis]MBF7096971.1 molybdopterin molybdotransferase MoeA [Alkalibacter mobilis]
MFDVKSVNETFRIIKEHFYDYQVNEEEISTENASGRILNEDITAREDMPPFDRSSVDGFAVIAKETFGASESMPAQMHLSGEVKMGETPKFEIKRGCAAYVPTGGELPKGSDAVVMVEYSEDFGDGDIFLNKTVAPGNNVVFRGDDVKKDSVVIKAGRKLRNQDIAMIAGLGYEKIKVRRRLKIGIISTGDEVIEIHEDPEGAQVRDMNAYGVYSMAREMGMEPKKYGIAKDDYEEIDRLVRKALEENDMVVISGGSSVGTKDVTVKVIDSLGEPGVLLHGIAVKPGKPTIIGRVGNKAVIGLPGHPASAFVIFQIFVKKILQAMENDDKAFEPYMEAVMLTNYPSNSGREEYLSVRLKNDGDKLWAEPVFGKSGMISLMTEADGYVHIKRESEGLNKNQSVKVRLF